MTSLSPYRILLAGGGTGGHLYPAIAVAQMIQVLKPEAKILFVGTSNKIEANVVPKLGYDFKTIWTSGFSRKLTLKNVLFPIKLMVSLVQSLLISIKYKPNVVVGTGSYVAGPVVWGASVMGAKVVLLEQNSFPGITNRLLEKKANEVHLSFEESKKYFRSNDKLHLSGNPIRINLEKKDKKGAREHFSLDDKKTLVVLGGSLGAKSINENISSIINELVEQDIQVVWQTGKLYYDQYKHYYSEMVKVMPFVDDMSAVYSCADLVVARAGATTIAEVSYLGVPVLFVPSPNVAANHQYKNAEALADKNAAEILEDSKQKEELLNRITILINDDDKLHEYAEKVKEFSQPDAAKVIAEHVIKLADAKNAGGML